MNKKQNSNLSDTDRKCLAVIDRNYQIGELLLGIEPLIYYEFNIRPMLNDPGVIDLNKHRLEVFSGSSPEFAGNID